MQQIQIQVFSFYVDTELFLHPVFKILSFSSYVGIYKQICCNYLNHFIIVNPIHVYDVHH